MSQFYRLPKIKAAFKSYINAFVSRYRDSPVIMAWELANEPRCSADGVRSLPRSTECTPHLITKWIDEMSTFIKTLDRHHLVTWGGEGGYNIKSNDRAYNGTDGGDFDSQLALANIDFGTFHTYPDWRGKTIEWADQWIVDHAESQRKGGKPVLHEEYGSHTPTPPCSLC